MLALSPRAVERLDSYKPAWPLPKIFRLTSGGKLIEGIFKGETINTPSMLCVEDALDGLRWAERIGGLAGADRALARPISPRSRDWVARTRLGGFPGRGSGDAVVHVDLPEDRGAVVRRAGRPAQAEAAKQIAALLEKEGVAYDIARLSRRAAGPAHLGRRDGGDRRYRGAAAVAGLGARRGGGEYAAAKRRTSAPLPALPRSRGVSGHINSEHRMPKVLISDKLSPAAVEIFRRRGIDVDLKPGLSPAELRAIIAPYDGLAVRSATKVTRELLDAATNLKVVGRAGIGVDNVDIRSATARGVVVMNTPHGNTITTAEHAIAMMFALARQIPEASASTKAGKWEKNRFMGVELTGKTLGLIGCGNIGSIVADRAHRPEDAGASPTIRSSPRSARSTSAWRRSSSTTCWHAPTSSRCTRR